MNEIQVKEQATTLEQQAQDYQIQTNEDYSEAADFLKRVKGVEKEVKDYWKPAKEAAAKAHKAICKKEKTMLSICEKAESILKEKMLAYSQKVEAQRKAAEEEARKARQAEADKLLEQAAQAEQHGDAMAAEMAMAQADMVTQMTTKVEVAKPKVAGVSTRSKTVVKVVDDEKVPAYVNGFCIRKVDEKAILALHKLNPGLEIPGVVFEQEQILAVR